VFSTVPDQTGWRNISWREKLDHEARLSSKSFGDALEAAAPDELTGNNMPNQLLT